MKTSLRSLLLVVVLGCGAPVLAQSTPDIDHDPLDCTRVGRYPVIDADIKPGKEVRTAKVYFRAERYPKFYWVEMIVHDDNYVSILPKPSPTTKRIIYYIEAVDSAFNNAVEDEHDPEVRESCKDRPSPYLPGNEPGIIVGATEAGVPAIPPGFEAAGIVGTIATTGILSSGVGSGAGIGTAIAVGAGAAGAGGLAVVVAGGAPDDETDDPDVATPPPAPQPPTTPSSPTSPPAPPPGPTAPPPPGSTTTTVPGGPSTTTAPGPGTTTTTTTVPGPSTTTVVTTSTTSSSTTTTTVPPLDAGCFSVTSPGSCHVRVDATCIQPPADRYDWVLDVGDQWQQVVINDGDAIENHSWSLLQCPLIGGANLGFRLTATRGIETDTATKTVFVNGRLLLEAEATRLAAAPVSLDTHLAVPRVDGSARGRILVDGQLLREIDGSQPVRIQARSPGGTRTVEAVVATPGNAPGTWRFGFGERSFVAGSIRVVSGTTLSVTRDAVVFRVTGEANERFSFTFDVVP